MTSPMFTRGFSFGMVTPLELEGVGTVAPLEGVILVTNSRSGKGESTENGSNPTTLQGEGIDAPATQQDDEGEPTFAFKGAAVLHPRKGKSENADRSALRVWSRLSLGLASRLRAAAGGIPARFR